MAQQKKQRTFQREHCPIRWLFWKREKQRTFKLERYPIKCLLSTFQEEGWSCEHCIDEGDDKICAWEPEDWDLYGSEESSKKAPCDYWQKRLECRAFGASLNTSLLDTSGQKICEVSGWWLNPGMIISDERNAFLTMGTISELLETAFQLIIKHKHLFSRVSPLDIPFITNLTLYDEFNSLELEQEVLDTFLKFNPAVIYSLGHNEPGAAGFSEYQDDEWKSYWEEKLLEHGWQRDGQLWYTLIEENCPPEPDPNLLEE